MNKARARALKSMLKPIIRFWLRGSETLQSFVDVLKVAFVEAAVEEMLRTERQVNISRISMMTGVHRKDAAKIFKQGNVPERALPDLVTRVLATWEQDPRFQTKTGKPRTLSFEGENSEFVELVERVCRGIKPATVLYELERSQSVKKSKRGLRLARASNKRTKDIERAVSFLSRDIQSLISAVDENLDANEELSPNLHATTEYDRVYVSDLPVIREWLWREGRKFHKRAREFISKHDKDSVDKPGERATARVAVTAFSIAEPEPLQEWTVDELR